ncbi:MAG TPA: replication initiation factor domain-containing protein, partial [Thiolinea sp.]|nr:replication initiation factor domain-containing protein [Thiolinea sp.]
ISRVDVALDLSGEWCREQGYTVPLLFRAAVNDGLFRSDKQRNPHMQQSFSTAGDWSALVVGNITPDAYDPLVHCLAGLTAYIGNRKSSDDFFRIYEKGKELLGAMAEAESVDRAWIRIEHEMSRKASGRTLPLAVMLKPDEYFCADRGGVRAIMERLRQSRTLAAAEQWQRAQFRREKGLLLSKKIHWARQSYGRLIHTLTDRGISPEDIIRWLSRTSGLKEFVFDLSGPANDAGPWEVAA